MVRYIGSRRSPADSEQMTKGRWRVLPIGQSKPQMKQSIRRSVNRSTEENREKQRYGGEMKGKRSSARKYANQGTLFDVRSSLIHRR